MNELIHAVALVAVIERLCQTECLLINPDSAARAANDTTRLFAHRRDVAFVATEALLASKRVKRAR